MKSRPIIKEIDVEKEEEEAGCKKRTAITKLAEFSFFFFFYHTARLVGS